MNRPNRVQRLLHSVSATNQAMHPDRTKPQCRANNDNPMVVVLVAVVLGILTARFAEINAGTNWCVSVLSLSIWNYKFWFQGERSAGWLFLAITFCSAAWFASYSRLYPSSEVGRFATMQPQPVVVEGTVISNPRIGSLPTPDPMCTLPQYAHTRVELAVDRLRSGEKWLPATGHTMIIIRGQIGKYSAGDHLRVVGLLTQQNEAMNPGQYSVAEHERTHRRLCRIFCQHHAAVTILRRARSYDPRFIIPSIRRQAQSLLHRHIGPEQRALSAALVLGIRDSLERQRIDAFFHTGTIHLLAISGLHVGILASVLFLVGRAALIPPRYALWSAMFISLFYAALTEAKAPVVRATILVWLFCLSWLLRRRILSFNVLAAAAIVVLAVNPMELFQTGAQLSFLAVAALFRFGPNMQSNKPPSALDRLITENQSWLTQLFFLLARRTADLFFLSVAIWLVTLPLVMYRFHIVTPIALALNVFLWIPIALALLAGFLVLVLGLFAPPLAGLSGRFCELSLWLLESCVNTVHTWHWSYFWVPGPTLWSVIGCYASLAIMIALPSNAIRTRWFILVGAIWITCGMLGTDVLPGHPRRTNPEQFRCTFLAVGHGCSVVLETPRGGTMIYDTGCLGSPHRAVHIISNFLWSRGISRVDAVVLSHADADHYNALPGLLPRFPIGRVYTSPFMFRSPNDSLEALRQAIQSHHVPMDILAAGDQIADGGVTLRVLSPPEDQIVEGDNANSLVVEIRFHGQTIVLTGDVEGGGLDHLVANHSMDCDVVMAPHHGSMKSEPGRFAQWCRPEWVVISGGLRDDTELTIDAFHNAGATVFHTAAHGATEISLTHTGIDGRSWLEND